MALEISAARADPALLDLPWRVPLEAWPEDLLAALPRGISRHVVRFVRLSGRVLAVKEINSELARREYDLLRSLNRLDMPCVEPFAVVSGRIGLDGEPLDACLITRHLQFSLPYRALYSQNLRKGTAVRLIDALAVLLVRLHLTGFWWGDVSLSNTLFRRDAGAFAAYLVDAETGELRQQLSDGQREHDLEIARVNIAGELMDLEAGGLLQEDRDPVAVSERIVLRYRDLWDALTGQRAHRGHRALAGRRPDPAAQRPRLRRRRARHHHRHRRHVDPDPAQGRRRRAPLPPAAAAHRSRRAREPGPPAAQRPRRLHGRDRTAGRGRGDRRPRLGPPIYEPVTRRVPRELVAKLEPAELFHEVLEHRWYMAERAQHDIPIEAAIDDYVRLRAAEQARRAGGARGRHP